MTRVVGIDLGTTNTVVAAVRDGRAHTLADEDGHVLVPSVVSFHPNGSVLVGRVAKERRSIDPKNTIFSVKRLIGRSWDTEEVRRSRARLPFEMREGPGQAALVVARGETYTLPEISAFVLRKAKSLADDALGNKVEQAVITVPANFNDLQRAATKVAGRVAGLEVSRILNEPTAAALAYGYGKATSERLAVYDFGGGTFDVTLLDLSNNVFEVLATAGNTFLGGDDIDVAIAERMADEFLKKHRYDPKSDPLSFHRFRLAAESIKHDLSTAEEASAEVSEVTHGPGGKALGFRFTMTRGELELLAGPIVDRTFDVCREALSVARVGVGELDQVLLVGGSTRIPLVRRRVEEFFRRQAKAHVSPDEVVAIGAAIQATALAGAERRRGTVPPAPAALRRSQQPGVPRSTLPGGPGAESPAEPGRLRTQEAASGPDTHPFEQRPRMPTRPGLTPPERSGDRPAPGPSASTLMGLGRGKVRTGAGLGPEADAAQRTATRTLESAGAAAREAERQTGGLPPLPPPPPPPLVPPLVPPPVREESAAFTLDDDEIEEVTSAGGRPALPTEVDLFSAEDAGLDGASLPLPEVPDDVPTRVGAPPGPEAQPSAAVPFRPPSFAPPPILVDVTPLTLGVETVSGYSDSIIGRNTPVPCEQTREFVTASDNQTTVRVRIGQGESPRFGENTLLGELELSGLRPGPRGSVPISVTFALDTNGMLNVSARDAHTGRETSVEVRLVGLPDAQQIAGIAARQAQQHTL